MTTAKELLVKLISDPASAVDVPADATAALLLENSALQSTLAGIVLTAGKTATSAAAVTTEPTAPHLLSANEVATKLGVRPAYVYDLARRRELPAVRLGRKYKRFRASDVDAYVRQRADSGERSRPVQFHVK